MEKTLEAFALTEAGAFLNEFDDKSVEWHGMSRRKELC